MTETINHSISEDATWTGAELAVVAVLQLVLILVSYRLDRAKNPVIVSESACAMLLGFTFGLALKIISPSQAEKNGMNPQILFFGLLPPIILEAGFNMKKRGFFSNFSTILLLAIVGTLIATFVTGALLIWIGKLKLITKLTTTEALLYGSLISAVDPVATLSVFKKNGAPPLLFNLVFGESVLNDGVAIVAFSIFQQLINHGIEDVTPQDIGIVILKVLSIGLGSVLFAGIVCCSSAFILKNADPILQHYPSYEISIILVSAYLSYVLADLAGLSGIVALFFSGVLMSHYHLYNIAEESATALRHLLSTTAFMAENFIFIYLGVSFVAFSGSFTWDWSFIFVNIAACMIGRFVNTFPLCMMSNCRRKKSIPWSYMVIIWFAGLRGAIAFALALNVTTPDSKHSGVIKSSTLFTVIFTTLVFGMGTGPLLRYYKLTSKDEGIDWEDATEKLLPQTDHSKENDIEQEEDGKGIHGMWEDVDEKYLKPLFGGNPRIQKSHDESNSSTTSHSNASNRLIRHISLTEIARNHDATMTMS